MFWPQEEASISMGSRTEADIVSAAKQLRKETGVPVLASVLDSSDSESIQQWTNTTLNEFGGVDKLLVNAGRPPAGKFEDFSYNNWQAAFELNLLSAARMIRTELSSMRERGEGSILTITSMSVKEPIDLLILSNVIRSGVTSLVKSISKQLCSDNILLNNLMPGCINTDRIRILYGLSS